MSKSRADIEFEQALATAEKESSNVLEQVEMLVEIAMGLQQKPKSSQQLLNSVALYDRALQLCSESDLLQRARIQARRATALQSIPDTGSEFLFLAQAGFETAMPVLKELGRDEEIAEAQMNLGLVLQSLAGMNKALITDAITAYQQAIKFFNKDQFQPEYAILQNNLATAFLSIPMNDERAKMREALAVQCFEQALFVVNLIDHPSEYAMLQNNLGNALQYASSSHAVENNLRALDAYDEALKVRTKKDTPLEYANTIANKANCLRNLPDDVENPQMGNTKRITETLKLYQEAKDLFDQFGEQTKASMLDDIICEIRAEIGPNDDAASEQEPDFGEARIQEYL